MHLISFTNVTIIYITIRCTIIMRVEDMQMIYEITYILSKHSINKHDRIQHLFLKYWFEVTSTRKNLYTTNMSYEMIYFVHFFSVSQKMLEYNLHRWIGVKRVISFQLIQEHYKFFGIYVFFRWLQLDFENENDVKLWYTLYNTE